MTIRRERPVRRSRIAAVTAIVVTVFTVITACSHSSHTVAETVTVGAGTGHSVPADMASLSVELKSLANGDFRDPAVAGFLSALSPQGVMRIGGSTGDTTFWTSSDERPPSWSTGTVTPSDLTALHTVLVKAGWRAVLQVNLKYKDAARAADEARVAQQILGSTLAGIEIGNEPNYYFSDVRRFLAQFKEFATRIRAAAPGVPIVGPDTAHLAYPFLAAASAGLADENLAEVTMHHYPATGCPGSGAAPATSALLSGGFLYNERVAAEKLVAAAQQDHALPVMSETNSANCGGIDGFSNSPVTSLWAVQYGLQLASNGVQRANFHTSLASACTGYAPLCRSASGQPLHAQPLFYGMVALNQLGSGTVLSTTHRGSPSVWAMALHTSAGMSVVVMNTDLAAGAPPMRLTLDLGRAYGSVQVAPLRTSSASPGCGSNRYGPCFTGSGSHTVSHVSLVVPAAGAVLVKAS